MPVTIEQMKKVKRLFEEFRPEHYELTLEPDRRSASFAGTVTITGRKVGRPSHRVTLHQKDLKIKKATLKVKDKKGQVKEIELDRVNCHGGFNELRLHSKNILYPGQYTIEIEFGGRITKPMHGIYPGEFEYKGKPEQLIATQFESHHAREAFPCIDEPEAKASFSLAIISPVSDVVISNTPVLLETKKGTKKTTKFADTPRMSTYLLAFVMGKMKYKEKKTSKGVVVRAYATPDNVNTVNFALDAAIKSLDYLDEYFGIKYPLPKLDLAAIPDFSAAAMENWGLVTFRESCMLVSKDSTVASRQFVATCVAHELAHQWFGNLVTMKWWDDLWLNESFATIMSYMAIDHIYPQWSIWDQFVGHEIAHAIRRDSLRDVQALRQEVNHPDEINTLFDPAIVYAKGAAVLNMVHSYVGDTAFQKGLSIYFKRHAYANAVAADLWKALDEVCRLELGPFMEQWLNRPGYPIVSVDHAPGSSSFTARQHRLIVGKHKPADAAVIWTVPLRASEPTDKAVLSSAYDTYGINRDEQRTTPLFVNEGASSYFVANYTNREHSEELIQAISTKKLATLDRLAYLESHLMMEKACEIKTTAMLHLLTAYEEETDESVWGTMGAVLGSAKTLVFGNENAEDALNKMALELVMPMYERVGWAAKKNETDREGRLRTLVLSLALAGELPEAIAKALSLFGSFSEPEDLSPDVREVVYAAGVRHGTDKEFNKLLALYKKINNSENKEDIAHALCLSRKAAQINKLTVLLTTDAIRLQDIRSWFVWLLRNEYSRLQAWNWLKDNWHWIEKNFGSDKSYEDYVKYTGMVFSRQSELDEFNKFFEPKTGEPALTRAIKLGRQEIEARVLWRENNEVELLEMLTTRFL